MAAETDSYDDFDEAIFENEEEILPENVKTELKAKEVKPVKNSNLATWRKIEDYWDNYHLNKKINDNPFDDQYSDYLLDG